MRREIIVSIVLLLAVVAGSVYFFSRYEKKDVTANVAKGLPPQTVLAFSSDKLEKGIESLASLSPFEGLFSDTSLSILKDEHAAFMRQLVVDSTSSWKGIVVVARASSEALGMLFLLEKNTFLEKLEDSNAEELSNGIYKWTMDQRAYYAIDNDGVYAVSSHLGLVESSQQSYFSDKESLLNEEVKGKKDFLLINFSALNWLVPSAFDLQKLGVQRDLKTLQGIGVYDLTTTENSMTLMGSVKPSAMLSSLHPKFHGEAKAMTAFDIIPEQAPMFVIKTGMRSMEVLLSKSSDASFAAAVDSFNLRNGVDLIQDFASSLGDESVSGLISAFDHRITTTAYTMWQVSEMERMILFLQAMDSSFVVNEDSLCTGATSDSRFLTWLPSAGPKAHTKAHFMLFNDFLIVAGNQEVLGDLYRSMSSGAVFRSSSHYALMSSWIARESNVFAYLNPQLCYALPLDITLGAMAEIYPRSIKSLKSMDVVACQLVKNNDRFFSHIFLHQVEETARQQVVQWKRQVSGPVSYGPFLVSNYVSKTNDILVADASGKVTVMDENGRVLWNFAAGSPLTGSPKEIDVYSNNKIQYLVNTENKLRLLDRKGNEVSAYPIALPDAISGLPVVYDLKKRKEYSLMVPCADGNIYGYRGNGRPIPGWSPKTMLAASKGELQYFNKGGTDYYLLSDVEGHIYVWKTDGKDALEPIATSSSIVSNLTLRFGATLEQCKVLAFDATGSLVTAGLDGTISKVLIDENLKDATAFWQELDGNAGKELVVYKGSKIKVVQQNGRITTSIALEEPASHVQMVIGQDGELLLAAVLPSKIVFHAADGRAVLELPQANCNGYLSLGDFTKDGALDLVTSTGDEVILIKNIF